MASKEVEKYISETLEKGYSKFKVREALMQAGYSDEEINEAFKIYEEPEKETEKVGFWKSTKTGVSVFFDSFSILLKKPIFILPILFSWLVVAFIILYLRYYFVFPKGIFPVFGIFFFAIFLITFIISISNLLMLEFVEQIESGKKASLFKALGEVISIDLIRVIPISLVWAIIWFMIFVIRVLTSKATKNSKRATPSIRDAARTLGGMNNGPFTWLKLGLSMFEKLVRMTVFMTLPAISWENKGPEKAFKRAVEIIKQHPFQFINAYSLTGFAGLLMALPLLPIYILDEMGIALSSTVWLIVLIYEGIIWSLGIYLEQMNVSLLYLWHLKWLRKGGVGDIESVEKPNLLDEVYELKKEMSIPSPPFKK
jgi:hypothetical protein